MAVLLLRAMELLKPWRWTGGNDTRDVWRLGLVLWCFPWTMRRWLRLTPVLARRHANEPLVAALRAQPTVPVIATNGFAPVVKPLLRSLGFGNSPVAAVRPGKFADRTAGKLAAANRICGAPNVRTALVLTDSPKDSDLLQACRLPLLTTWPEAQYRPALSHVYLPGEYTSHVKRPGEHYLRRALLQEDLPVWILASLSLAVSPWTHILGLFCLLGSFWTIYELGYVDNDLMAHKLETDPALSNTYHQRLVATPTWTPWIWAAALGAAGTWLVRWPGSATWVDLASWSAVLLLTFGWFHLYNRCNKTSRIWMFPGLQFARAAAFTTLVPIVPVGAMAIAALVLSRWIPYYLYRLAGAGWPLRAQFDLAKVLIFLLLCASLAISNGWRSVINWTALALLLWSLYRARLELIAAVKAFTLLRPAAARSDSAHDRH